jgi:hypothetical protein
MPLVVVEVFDHFLQDYTVDVLEVASSSYGFAETTYYISQILPPMKR